MIRTSSTSKMFRLFVFLRILLPRTPTRTRLRFVASRRRHCLTLSLSPLSCPRSVLHSTERTNYRKSLKAARYSRLVPQPSNFVAKFPPTKCVKSLVSRFGQKFMWRFPRLVGHTTVAVQPGKKKIARGIYTKMFLQTLRPSY